MWCRVETKLEAAAKVDDLTAIMTIQRQIEATTVLLAHLDPVARMKDETFATALELAEGDDRMTRIISKCREAAAIMHEPKPK